MDAETNNILEQAAAGTLKPDDAIAQLVAKGRHPVEAEEFVLLAMGGSDRIDIGEDGKKYFLTTDGRVPMGPDGWPVIT